MPIPCLVTDAHARGTNYVPLEVKAEQSSDCLAVSAGASSSTHTLIMMIPTTKYFVKIIDRVSDQVMLLIHVLSYDRNGILLQATCQMEGQAMNMANTNSQLVLVYGLLSRLYRGHILYLLATLALSRAFLRSGC